MVTCVFLVPFLFAQDQMAVTTKVFGNVEIFKKKGSSLKLKQGSILSIGDQIKTSRGSFAAIIFIDDRSILKIKENSILTINGQRKRGSISKEINLQGGTLRAQVTDQNRKNFIIESSVSVASVKGTYFLKSY